MEAACQHYDVIKDIGCNIAPKKVSLTASTKQLAKSISKLVPGSPGLVSQYTLLGSDTKSGSSWRNKAPTKLDQRFSKAAKRAARSRLFTRLAGGAMAAKLFAAVVRPTATFATEITGLTDKLLKKLQQWSVELRHRSKGASRRATLLLHGDSTGLQATAAIRRWAKECWTSVMEPTRRFAPTIWQRMWSTIAV